MSAANRTIPRATAAPAVTVRRLAPGGGLTTSAIRKAVRLAAGDRPVGEVSIAIVDDARIARVHQEYMGDDRPTDVLTFDLRDDAESPVLVGEIVVSVDTARRQAARRGLPATEELTRYIVHGVLHLLGLDDRTPAERRRMRREENRLLGVLAEEATAPRSVSAARQRPRADRRVSRTRPLQGSRKKR